MTAGETAAIIGAVAGVVLAVAVVFALASLTRTLRQARTTMDELRSQALPLLREARTTLEDAQAELIRVHGVIDRAESIGGTVDSASKLAYLAFSNPVIKVMALGAGTSRAARRLRRRRGA